MNYKYPRPVITCDVALFCVKDRKPHLLLIKRGKDPFAGYYALPGGHLEMDEELEDCALRELEEETSIGEDLIAIIRQIKAIGTRGRDPRDRYVTVLYGALADPTAFNQAVAGDDAADHKWVPVYEVEQMNLAFDHKELCEEGIRWFGS